jgi:hypothetical protein
LQALIDSNERLTLAILRLVNPVDHGGNGVSPPPPPEHNPVIPTTNLPFGVLMVTMTSKVMLRMEGKKNNKSKKKMAMKLPKKPPLLQELQEGLLNNNPPFMVPKEGQGDQEGVKQPNSNVLQLKMTM